MTLGFTSNPALVWLVIHLSLFEMHFVLLLNINICRVWIHSNTWNICAFTSISRRFVWIFFFRLYTSFNRKCSWSFTATTKPVEINPKYCSNALHFLYIREKKNKNKLLCYILRWMTNWKLRTIYDPYNSPWQQKCQDENKISSVVVREHQE